MSLVSQGKLYIVATPIGNLEDITLRALSVLRSAAMVWAEDTRRARKLLSHYEISVPCARYREEAALLQKQHILDACREGRDIVLLSDAGTPVISDPGWSLADLAWKSGIQVVPIPGPSAPVAALSACGFPVARFAFWGFLPRSPAKVRRALEALLAWPCGVFFESPHRIVATLSRLQQYAPADLEVCIARELSKHFEEIVRGKLETVLSHFQEKPPQGEFCVILYSPTGLGGASGSDTDSE